MVTVLEGYEFQVYYNSEYGIVYVDYCGNEKGGAYPNVTARYEKSIASVISNVSIEKGSIAKVELIYKDEIKETRTNDLNKELRFDVSKIGTGWYKVKATSSEGKVRYAWAKATNITDALKIPVVTFVPAEPDGDNGWYKTKGKVEVKIETDSPSAKEIHYTLSGAHTEGEKTVQGTSTSFDITTSGETTMKIWAEDGKGYQSKEITKEIKLDNIEPEISELKVTATKGKTDSNKKTWITSNRRNKSNSK